MNSPARAASLALFVLLLAFALIPQAAAMGISPPRAQLTFVPSTRYDLSVTLINNNPFPIEVETRVQGILEPTTAIRKPIRIGPQSSVSVPITVTTPASLPRPGYTTTYIFFAEKYLDANAGTISTRTEVGLTLVLWEPYPGNYAEVTANAPSIPQGKDTALNVLVSNFGTEPIVDGKVTVRVLAGDGALQDVFTFPNIAVGADSNKDYHDIIRSAGYNPGKYTLQTKLEYGPDGQNTSWFNGSFAVGTQDIDINALEGPLYLDTPVNRYVVHIESLWNLPLENVHASVELGSSKSQTPSVTINGFEKTTLSGFWETDKTVPPGNANAHVIVTFPGGTKDQLVPITVLATTPKPPEYQEPSRDAITLSGADATMIIIGIIVLVLGAIWVFGRFHRKPPKATGASMDSGAPAQTKS